MLAYLSIFPDQKFLNLVSDKALAEIIGNIPKLQVARPDLADVYEELEIRLKTVQEVRAALGK